MIDERKGCQTVAVDFNVNNLPRGTSISEFNKRHPCLRSQYAQATAVNYLTCQGMIIPRLVLGPIFKEKHILFMKIKYQTSATTQYGFLHNRSYLIFTRLYMNSKNRQPSHPSYDSGTPREERRIHPSLSHLGRRGLHWHSTALNDNSPQTSTQLPLL